MKVAIIIAIIILAVGWTILAYAIVTAPFDPQEYEDFDENSYH